MDSASSEERRYQGIAASPGIAHGRIALLGEKELSVPRYKIDPDRLQDEIVRFEHALIRTREQIQKIKEAIQKSLGEEEARIFDAHLLVLEDRALIDETIREMEKGQVNVEAAVWEVGNRYIDAFGQIDDEYLRERATDIRDVLRRLMSSLTGESLEHGERPEEKHVLVAHDVAPSDSACVDKNHLMGLVTDAGSKTSHTVIVARSLNIPTVVGMGDFKSKVRGDEVVLVDGYEGLVIVNPSEETLFKYGKLKDERASFEERMIAQSRKPSITRDGVSVKLMANIETPEEAVRSAELGADGVGLFRTEYMFLNGTKLPSEEEQYQAYLKTAEAMGDLPVVIRTLDLGGDKMAESSAFSIPPESNPFLGYRAIRYCLDHVELFSIQLRAILRASVHGNVQIMYPMISGSAELIQANRVLASVKEELREEGIPFDENVISGTMIEIPSAAIAADTLLGGSAFFSIGTNDLIQYLMAVDRLNDRVAHLYEPTHPAVVRTIEHVLKTAKRGGIEVGVCGEMAGDPVMVPLLVGLGVDSLSMSPGLLPNVKFILQNMEMSEAKDLASMALEETDGLKTLERLLEFYTARMAELY